MKKLLVTGLVLISILSSNGCKILKNKKLDKSYQKEVIKNDVAVSKINIDSLASSNKYIYDKSNTIVKETISYKTNVDAEDSIELSGTFQIDTAKSLKGDTALTLKGNGVVLTITRNPHNNSLTANIKKKGVNRTVPFNEMLINRTITNQKDLTDTSKNNVSFAKQKLDSLDKSEKKTINKKSELNKSKETGPNWYTVLIILGAVAIVCFFLWLYFKPKKVNVIAQKTTQKG